MAERTRPGEFEVIRRYLAPLATAPGALGLTDDAALIEPAPGRQLVLTVDAMIAGVHFLPDDPADLVARKLLRVNLSDLAAMAAKPLGYLLTTAWPRDLGEDWIAGFCAGLAADQAEYAVSLLGGDTVSTDGPMALTLTAVGEVARGEAVRRNGAVAGDRLYVTGTIGDGALGLLVAKGGLAGLAEAARAALLDRYRLPRPRTSVGPRLVGLAHAMLDVSDGLVADARHIAEASGVALEIEQARVPLSPAAAAAVAAEPALWPAVLTGGDDYELLFAAPPGATPVLDRIARETGVAIAEIGSMRVGHGVGVLDSAGRTVALAQSGWRHF